MDINKPLSLLDYEITVDNSLQNTILHFIEIEKNRVILIHITGKSQKGL